MAILVYSPEGKMVRKTTLAVAVAAADSVGKTIVVTSSITLSDDLTIPSTMALEIKKGGLITVANTKTLTIEAPFTAGLYQVFAGDGSVVLNSSTHTKVHWFWSGTGPISSALQLACSAAKRVHIPSGSFTLDSTQVALQSGNVVYGDGDSTILTATADIAGAGFGGLFLASGTVGTAIHDLKFDGAGYACGLITASSASFIYVYNNWIIDCGGSATVAKGIDIREDCDLGWITNNYVYHCHTGIHATKASRIKVCNNTVERIQGAGIYFEVGNYNLAEGNLVQDCADIGIDIEGGTGHSVIGNTIKRCNNAEIGLYGDSYPASTMGLHNITWSANNIVREQYYTDMAGAAQTVSLTYGSFHIWTLGHTGAVGNNSNLTFTGNSIKTVAGTAIRSAQLANAQSHLTISGNTIETISAGSFMLFNAVDSLKITNNTFISYQNNDEAYNLIQELTNSYIGQNVFHYKGGKAISAASDYCLQFVSRGASSTLVEANTFIGCGPYAIYITSGSGYTFQDNKLSSVPVANGGLVMINTEAKFNNQRLLISIPENVSATQDLQSYECFYGSVATENGPNFKGVLEIVSASTRRNKYDLNFYRGILYSANGTGSASGYLSSATWYAAFSAGTIIFTGASAFDGSSFLDVVISK